MTDSGKPEIIPGMQVRSIHWKDGDVDPSDNMTVVHVHNGKAWVEGEGWSPHLRDIDVLVPAPQKWEVGHTYKPKPGHEMHDFQGEWIRLKIVAVDQGAAFYRRADDTCPDAHGYLEADWRRSFTEVDASE